MRVITGTAKGVTLNSLSGRETRPTSDKIKEAMFSAIQFNVEGAIVLDLFAGSGQLGIEALSRGAEKVYFADGSADAVSVIKSNLKKTGFEGECYRIDRKPYHVYMRIVKEKFDIVFLDPPYGKGIITNVLPMLTPKMNINGIIVCEHEKQLILPANINGFTITKTRGYGSIGLTFYERV